MACIQISNSTYKALLGEATAILNLAYKVMLDMPLS